jgi:hypothetical protein
LLQEQGYRRPDYYNMLKNKEYWNDLGTYSNVARTVLVSYEKKLIAME